ncbi:alpha/beta hydrolase [Sphingomonas sp.]|uniref:alpha/beta fold hydrolase n=1 Tax=Sphingomonas sp. TaxID=28214 RepID=UPI000DB618F6|nr:alpha/beta hydrolase [Sphingomonas sp.]PZU10894.1 MAG: alpha/beta hydrolase [Sphingomonas sp.]
MSNVPVSKRFRSQSLDLHYVDWGGDDLPILILLHGGNDHCRSWDRIAEALSDRFRVIAPDLRGHGDSGWSNDGHYSITAHVLDLLALYEALGVETAPILAHSFGGMVALRFAGLYPAAVSRLILLESAGRFDAEAAWLATPVEHRITDYFEKLRKAAASRPRPYASLAEAAARMKERNPRLSDALALHLADHGTHPGEDGQRRWKFDPRIRARFPHDISFEERRRLRWQVAAAVLIVDGAEHFGAPDRTPLDIPGARRDIIAEAGHWPHHDRPDDVIAVILPFLDQGSLGQG